LDAAAVCAKLKALFKFMEITDSMKFILVVSVFGYLMMLFQQHSAEW
jgi:hypothetical protein